MLCLMGVQLYESRTEGFKGLLKQGEIGFHGPVFAERFTSVWAVSSFANRKNKVDDGCYAQRLYLLNRPTGLLPKTQKHS